MRKAVRLYVDFHKYDPKKVGEFPASFEIPQEATFVGMAKNVMYRSTKLNPLTLKDEGAIDYIHEHGKDVKAYRFDARAEGPVHVVPKRIWGVDELVFLGKSLGYEYEDHEGTLVTGDVKRPLPDLYATPDGRALLIIQDRKKVLAAIWGGKLGVEPRGIVH